MAVGGDDDAGTGVDEALAECRGAEAAEDDGVNDAEAGAGQHGDDGFGDAGQVDGGAVAGAETQGGQAVGGGVEGAAVEPAGAGGVAPVEGGGPGGVPVKVLGGCFPVFDNVVIGGDDVVVEPGDGGGRV